MTLWLEALHIGRRSDPRWREQAALDLLAGRFLSALPTDASGSLLLVDEPSPGRAAPGPLRGLALEVARWNREAAFDQMGSRVPPAGPFGIAAVRIPRSREALSYALRHAASRLRPGGLLVVYGANDEGVGSSGDLLAEAGVDDAVTWASGKRCRVLGGRVPDPPAPPRPEEAMLGWELELPGLPALAWVSYPGVFASRRLDAGTRLLLESLPALPGGSRVLDWGAGSGEIGAFVQVRDGARERARGDLQRGASAQTLACPPAGIRVILLERDALAVAAARRNVPDAQVVEGDGWHALGTLPGEEALFSHVLANPPYHVGKAESIEPVQNFLEGVPDHLQPGGELRFVVQRRLRVQPLLEARFTSVEVVADEGPFRVWRAGEPRTPDPTL